MSQKKVVEKIKNYFMFSNFFPENLSVYEVMSKNVVETKRPQIIHCGPSALLPG